MVKVAIKQGTFFFNSPLSYNCKHSLESRHEVIPSRTRHFSVMEKYGMLLDTILARGY